VLVAVSILFQRLQRESVEWTPDSLQSPDGDVEVSRRRLDAGMSQQNLNRAHIGAGVKHMCGGGMTKQVGMDAAFDASTFACFKTYKANRAVIER
jgi:hypothetical protein